MFKIKPAKTTRVMLLMEILIIFIWVLIVGKNYLNFDPSFWPYGREFGLAVRTHYIWTDLFKCGTCIFWNGSVRGGAPAFAEIQGSVLHPIVVLTTLLAGVVNGSKLVVLFSLFIAGLAQWWLAKRLGVGSLARLWTAGMAVVGGHLAGRMELGLVGVVLSTASCSLAIAAAVDLGITGKRRSAILLGIILALAIVSGQGYMQIAFLIGVVPPLILFLFDDKWHFNKAWKEFLLAGLLAILLAGVFLVPMLHFLPNFDKARDPIFGAAQPLAYIPLNLVISDVSFYFNEVLKPLPYPNLYTAYLGWIPILLAIVGIRFFPRAFRRTFLFIIISIGLLFIISSAIPFKWLINTFPAIGAIRFTTFFAGLANPLILCLSAWGLQGLFDLKTSRPAISIKDPQPESNLTISFNPMVLLLFVPMFFALKSAYLFGQNWLYLIPNSKLLWESTEMMQTDSTQWVSFQDGEHYWNIPALDNSLKLNDVFSTQLWKNRDIPPAYLEATRDPSALENTDLLFSNPEISAIRHPGVTYAYILAGDAKIACRAHATDGVIDISCPDSPDGALMVMENNWQGWRAWRDEDSTPLLDSQWLSVAAPAGTHSYSFRYRPWDVWAGIGLTLLGVAGCIFFWRKPRN
jgi:hypothetical protein